MENNNDNALKVAGHEKKEHGFPESRDLLQYITDVSLNAIAYYKVIMDGEKRVIDFEYQFQNAAHRKSQGGKNLVGKRVIEMNPGIKEREVFSMLVKTAETGEQQTLETYYNRQGQDSWYRIVSAKYGEGIITSSEDITTQKKAEREIKDQSHFIRTLTDMAHAVITITKHPSGEVEFSNRNGMAVLGYDAGEISRVGQEGVLKLLHPEDVARVKDYYLRFDNLKDKEENRIEYRIRNKAGEWVWFEVRGKVFKRDVTGKVTHTLRTAFDITARKKAEQKMIQDRELLESTINCSLDRINVMESVRNSDGSIVDFRIIMVNNAAKEKYGDMTGQLMVKEHPGVIPAGIFDAFVQVLETGIPQQYEKHYNHEGMDIWVHHSVVKLNDGIVNTTRDITGIKKSEQEILRLREQIKNLSKAK